MAESIETTQKLLLDEAYGSRINEYKCMNKRNGLLLINHYERRRYNRKHRKSSNLNASFNVNHILYYAKIANQYDNISWNQVLQLLSTKKLTRKRF